nr:MAG TPA: hypothetical protein [Caudoviricetes sp.]
MITLKDVEKLGFELVSRERGTASKHEENVPNCVYNEMLKRYYESAKDGGRPLTVIYATINGEHWACDATTSTLNGEYVGLYCLSNFRRAVPCDMYLFKRGAIPFDCYVMDGDEFLSEADSEDEMYSNGAERFSKDDGIEKLETFVKEVEKRINGRTIDGYTERR